MDRKNKPLAFSITGAAKEAKVGRDLIYRGINSGRLRSVKIGGRRIILGESLLDWLRELESETSIAMGFSNSGTRHE